MSVEDRTPTASGNLAQALRDSPQRMENVLSSLREVVYSRVALTQEVIYVNPAVEVMTGYAPVAFIEDARLWLEIVHPCDRERVEAGLGRLIHEDAIEIEYRIVRPDGSVRIVQDTARLIRNGDGHPLRIDGVATDVTERRFAEARVDYLTRHDRVTGLPNRSLLRERLEHALVRAQRRQERVSVLWIDLDNFKEINKELGHTAGDELLRLAARRIEGCLRDTDTLSRLDGDDFGILIDDAVAEVGQLLAIGEKIVNAFTEPFVIDGQEVFLTVSIGMDAHPPGSRSAEGLMHGAEVALWQAKNDGGNSCRFHAPQTGERPSRIVDLRARLRRALDKGEFGVRFQPRVSLSSGAITGAEALLYWNNPELGPMSPGQFIPLAEESGLIVPIGNWVLRTACTRAQEWRSAGHALEIAINLSPRELREQDLVSMVAAVLCETGLPAHLLELEVTETTAMLNPERAIGLMTALRQLGIRLAVDDFGTGRSSLGYLKRFPLQRLKIDRAFLQDMSPGSQDIAIGKAIVALAKGLKLATTVEGIENRVQHDFAAMLGCDEYQGYYFSPPLDAADFTALLQDAAAAKAYVLHHAQRSHVADINLLEPGLHANPGWCRTPDDAGRPAASYVAAA
jgi:diguanylate cyclase (GGDEF)-like protein/PAS domain S-box-containing protein